MPILAYNMWVLESMYRHLKEIWKSLTIIAANLNMKLKQVRSPDNNHLSLWKSFFLHSYKTKGEYHHVISLKLS